MNVAQIKIYLLLTTLLTIYDGLSPQLPARSIEKYYSQIEFKYDKVLGIGHEKGVTRRDPSDMIKVKDTCYDRGWSVLKGRRTKLHEL